MTLFVHRRLFIGVFVSVVVLVTMLFQTTARGRYETSTSVQTTDMANYLTQPSCNNSTPQPITKCFSEDLSARNFERLLRLVDRCERPRRQGGARWVERGETLVPADYGNIFVDDKHKVLYCSVPKVASTNWKRVMLMLSGKVNVSRLEDLQSSDVHHDLQAQHLLLLSQLKPDEIRWRLKTYFKFLFVRHPLERVVSAYENKFATPSYQYFQVRLGRDIIRRYRSNPSSESLKRGHDVTFLEFVRYLGDQTPEEYRMLNEHWQPYSELCHPCQVHYDVIGKYETLGDDAVHVIDVIANKTAADDNGSLAARLRFPAGQRHVNRTGDVISRFAGIPADHLRRLNKLYADDFSLFGYEYQLRKDGTLAGYQTGTSSCRSDHHSTSFPDRTSLT